MRNSRSKVVLAQLPIPPVGPYPVRSNVPLAAGFLKLFAHRKGLTRHFDIEILSENSVNTLGDRGLVAEIAARDPKIIGFSCYLWNVERTLWAAERLRDELPNALIVLGGPEISLDNYWVLENDAVTHAVIGEGEATFAEFLDACSNDQYWPKIAGLWHKNNRNPAPRAPLAHLDDVASPYFEGILEPPTGRTLFLETTRGCRFHCGYCYYPKQHHSIRSLSGGEVAAHVNFALEHDVKEIFILDPTINQRVDFHDFLRMLAAKNKDGRVKFSGELRAEGIDEEAARLLREANFHELEIGLQSVNPKAQELMGRPVNLEAWERGVRNLIEAGIRTRLDLILGLPGDCPRTVRSGIEYLSRFQGEAEFQLFQLSVLPGTSFRENAGRLGLQYQVRPPYYVLQTPSLNLEQIVSLSIDAEEALGTSFDAPPEPEPFWLEPELLADACDGKRASISTGGYSSLSGAENLAPRIAERGVKINLDESDYEMPAAERRAVNFTLHLLSSDFSRDAGTVCELVADCLKANPHSSLQVLLEPTGDPRSLNAELTHDILSLYCNVNTYLNRYYSVQPYGGAGAARTYVLLTSSARERMNERKLEGLRETAAIVWLDGELSDEDAANGDYSLA